VRSWRRGRRRLGILGGNATAYFLKLPPVIPVDWVILGLAICSVVGIVFGTYPAWKAANLDPIESLRYERGGGQIMPDIYRQRQGDNGRRKQKSRPPLASRGQVQKRDDRFRAANYFMTR
jgi:hypothetical protein